jgi:hypothetical protein
MLRKPLNLEPVVASVNNPVALKHGDSVYCWCDPIVEVDENGREVVVHKEVSWN